MASLGIPSKLLTNIGPQFVSNFFVVDCKALGVNNITITEYYPQTSGPTKRFYSTIVSRLRHYLSEHQKDYNSCLLPLIYAYNVQSQSSLKVSAFNMVLTQTLRRSLQSYQNIIMLRKMTTTPSLCYEKLELVKKLRCSGNRTKRT